MMKKVFDYMGWDYRNGNVATLDGNDMVAAINKMAQSEDLNRFDSYNYSVYCEDSNRLNGYIQWLWGNPTNFFKLMEEWLNEKAD